MNNLSEVSELVEARTRENLHDAREKHDSLQVLNHIY